MSRINQILLGIAFVCLILWYILYVRQLGLSATPLEVTVDEDTAVTVQLEAKGVKNKEQLIEIVEQPKNGKLSYYLNRYLYFPNKDYFGTDRFSYRIRSGKKVSDPADVTIRITPRNDRPIAKENDLTTEEDKALEIELSGEDVDGDPLQYAVLKQPQFGNLSGIAPKLTYLPNEDFFGEDQFVFRVSDLSDTSLPSIVKIEVTPVNDAPVVRSSRKTTFRNTPIHFNLEAKDKDSEKIDYRIVSQPKHGTLQYQDNVYSYSPHKGFVGKDSMSFLAMDENSESNVANIEFDVRKIDHGINLEQVLNGFLKDGGVAIGSYKKPEHLFHSGQYTPASVLKIVTAAAALHYLGGEYRFKTEFYVDDDRNLYIKGYGDPSLGAKDWHEIARILQLKNIFDEDLNSLIIDTSAFAEELVVDGRRESIHYYDSPPSTLASNGNTVAVRIKPDRRIVMADDYTPLTSMIAKKAKYLPVGYQHFNVALNSEQSIQYSAELAQEIFREYGGFFENRVLGDRVPAGIKPFFVYHSPGDLTDIVKEMLRDSNNFIANQLILTLAYEKKGEGVNIETGAKIVTSFLKNEIGIQQNDFQLVEGSGLSTKNSIDLRAMLKVVNYFKTYRYLLPDLRVSRYADLAKAGRKWNIVAKSGTLSNTATLAGFIQLDNKEWKPFVIMLNDDTSVRGTVLEIIAQYYNS